MERVRDRKSKRKRRERTKRRGWAEEDREYCQRGTQRDTHTHTHTLTQRHREIMEKKNSIRETKKAWVIPARMGSPLFRHPLSRYFLSTYYDARQGNSYTLNNSSPGCLVTVTEVCKCSMMVSPKRERTTLHSRYPKTTGPESKGTYSLNIKSS